MTNRQELFIPKHTETDPSLKVSLPTDWKDTLVKNMKKVVDETWGDVVAHIRGDTQWRCATTAAEVRLSVSLTTIEVGALVFHLELNPDDIKILVRVHKNLYAKVKDRLLDIFDTLGTSPTSFIAAYYFAAANAATSLFSSHEADRRIAALLIKGGLG